MKAVGECGFKQLYPGFGHLEGLLGHQALRLLGAQLLSGILHFPSDMELGILLQKLSPGIRDSQLEPGIRKPSLLPSVKPLLEGGCAYWLAEKALLDPIMRSDTSNSRSGIGTPRCCSPALPLPGELIQGDVHHLAPPSEPGAIDSLRF